jgi:hypothetical protein
MLNLIYIMQKHSAGEDSKSAICAMSKSYCLSSLLRTGEHMKAGVSIFPVLQYS